MSETVQLLEFVRQSGPFEVDAEAAVIKGVRVIGLESANGRTYTREAVRGALGMYEGVGTNVNHPGRPGEPVTVERRNGWLANVRQDSDGGARADWHLLKADGMTAKILEVASRRPQLLALSHNATGVTRRQGGKEIVESIQAVHSVDCVVDGATTRGLHEGTEGVESGRVSDLIERLAVRRPGASRALSEMAQAGLATPATQVAVPAAQTGATEQDDHSAVFVNGILQAITACLKDDSLSWEQKESAVAQYMRTAKKHVGKAEGDMSAEKTKATEGTVTPPVTPNLQEQLDREKLANTALRLVMEAKLALTPILSKALEACKDEAEVKALLEEAKKTPAPSGNLPRSSERAAGGGTGKLTEGKGGQGGTPAIPTEPKALGRWLTTAGN